MEIKVRVPGSCGELVQGVHRGQPYLVTCPIDAYTTVWVSDAWQGQEGLGEKSCLALKLTLDFLGKTSFPYGIRLKSELPHGKGMASSSADIAAVSAAAAAALGKRLSPEEIFHIATAIEPTDPVFFPGHVCANQQDGSIYAEYADWPQLKIAIFDTGGTVDTLWLHSKFGMVGAEMPPPVFLSDAVYMEQQIAEAATRSAQANQMALPKPCFEELLKHALSRRALGLNTAHSGTVYGVLWPADMPWGDVEAHAREMAACMPQLDYLMSAQMISGGILYE